MVCTEGGGTYSSVKCFNPDLSSPGLEKVIPGQIRSTLDTSTPAVEFRVFPYLPKELRLKIWKFGVPSPRVVHLHPGIETGHNGSPYDADFTSNIDMFQGHSLHPIRKLALELWLFEELILGERLQAHHHARGTLLKFRDLETLIIAIEPFDPCHEYNEGGTRDSQFRKETFKYMELINTIDPAIAAQDPSDPYRFQTNRCIDSQLERRLDCSSDERPWKLQGLLDRARETLRDMWLKVRGWRIPQVEICAVLRNSEGL